MYKYANLFVLVGVCGFLVMLAIIALAIRASKKSAKRAHVRIVKISKQTKEKFPEPWRDISAECNARYEMVKKQEQNGRDWRYRLEYQ